MYRRAKISTGTNARPRDETIAESGPGIPDDSGRLVELTDAEIKRVEASLLRGRRHEPNDGLDEQIELPRGGRREQGQERLDFSYGNEARKWKGATADDALRRRNFPSCLPGRACLHIDHPSRRTG